MYSIIVHGGVGAVPHDKEEAVVAGVRKAVLAGSGVLAERGSSLDAVETAIRVLETNPLFNAGTGSVLTFDGEVEMDAAVAYGPALGFGAIAGIKNIEHPISLARMVMEKIDHVLLQGSGASSTGLGESMMRTLITKTACDSMRMGLDAQGAASSAVNMLSNMLGTESGIIVVDKHGGIGSAQNTPQMAHAYFREGMPEPVAGL
jgi:isoaspartyl peptidase/L-asparaginase-like protein (Ntn-hydrolase superfamily)